VEKIKIVRTLPTDYEVIIEKAWSYFKSGKSIFLKNSPLDPWFDHRSYYKRDINLKREQL